MRNNHTFFSIDSTPSPVRARIRSKIRPCSNLTQFRSRSVGSQHFGLSVLQHVPATVKCCTVHLLDIRQRAPNSAHWRGFKQKKCHTGVGTEFHKTPVLVVNRLWISSKAHECVIALCMIRCGLTPIHPLPDVSHVDENRDLKVCALKRGR